MGRHTPWQASAIDLMPRQNSHTPHAEVCAKEREPVAVHIGEITPGPTRKTRRSRAIFITLLAAPN
jgi:hypothetical protein